MAASPPNAIRSALKGSVGAKFNSSREARLVPISKNNTIAVQKKTEPDAGGECPRPPNAEGEASHKGIATSLAPWTPLHHAQKKDANAKESTPTLPL